MVLNGYLAAEGYLEPLLEELGGNGSVHGRLVLAERPKRPVAWAQNVWHAPETIAIASIGEAAAALRARQRNWALYSLAHHRRAALIEARLPSVSRKPLVFGVPAPAAPLGSWTLLAPDRLLAAARCSSPFANGVAEFVEDRQGPPARAYLKLWELFTLIAAKPAPGMRCLDLGASPGGWTWVLAELGADIFSVDKADLDPSVAARAGVRHLRRSAFSLEPAEIGPVDWLFADIICYPARLVGLIERWLASGLVRNIVCTLKFQGATDHDSARRFAALAGARLMHLSANKHELTGIILNIAGAPSSVRMR
jgi:23S rRNA (cytidine2498-2'-O)-methyltransferase